MGKKYKIRHRAVILYLGLKGKTPKQVYQDMEATLAEDMPLRREYGKEVGWQIQTWQEEPGRQPPSRKTAECPILSVFFFFFPFSRSRRLETANWLCLIICNRKTRNSYKLQAFGIFIN